MKIYLKALIGITVFLSISVNLEATDFVKNKNNQAKQLQYDGGGAPTAQTLSESEQEANTLYDLSILAANRNNLILARTLIEEAIQLNHFNLDYLAFATDIAFISKEFDRAEEYKSMILLVVQSSLGLENLSVAVILEQLAAINIAQKRYKQAKFRLQDSLALRQKLLGNSHLLIISSLNKLASLAILQQQPAIAEPLLKKSLDIAHKVLGPYNDNSAIVHASLANFYQNEGRLAEAEEYYKEAMSIWDNLPSDTPDRMISQNSFGKLLLGQQRFDDARLQFEQVLVLLKQHYEKGHPYIQQAKDNIKMLDAEHKIVIEKEVFYDELVQMLSFQLSKNKQSTLLIQKVP